MILFKTGRLKEAEKKAFETFRSNTYLFDLYFGRPGITIEKWEGSNLQTKDFAENLADFSEWLDKFTASEKFVHVSNAFVDIRKRLATEKDTETRQYLGKYERQLVDKL